ncbi:HDOD domain-containing protein [Inhella crocodyli]|uniref:HDOD domain-containing protein n=1 Tax=Inhella crocodyli TaxID=2499851 RepID=A0A3S3TDC9_9BURK|nr:HDOD domain-containing protein [Inhella crocodyli]RVT88526.1 HDOD domain-containing protein [Inhella crocodyli]
MTPAKPHAIPAAAERFFANHGQLQPMPEVATRLIKSFDDPNVSLRSLADLIEKDPTLSARVLRLANSARFSPSHNVATLIDAANTLGLDMLRNLSMAAAISGRFPDLKGLDRRAVWRHAATTAAHARTLGKLLRLDADEVYVAGMMLRTGQLLMAISEPDQVAEVERMATEPGSRYSLEQHRFGCTHADVTASLAAHWHFPAAMVQAFTDANEPLEVRPFSLMAAVLHLAEVLADAAGSADPVAALQAAVPELVQHVHLDLDDLRARVAAAGDPAQDVDALLQ